MTVRGGGEQYGDISNFGVPVYSESVKIVVSVSSWRDGISRIIQITEGEGFLGELARIDEERKGKVREDREIEKYDC